MAYLLDHEDILPADVVTSLAEAGADGRVNGRFSQLYSTPQRLDISAMTATQLEELLRVVLIAPLSTEGAGEEKPPQS